MRVVVFAALALAAFVVPARSRAESGDVFAPGGPLVFTVHPSGFAESETLDEKLARRAKGIRFICGGCARSDGRMTDEPFHPVRTLNAPGLAEALAVQP